MTIRAIDWRRHPRAAQYIQMIEEAADEAGIPEDVLGGVLFHESKFDKDARNDGGDEGIAQLNKRWHKDVDRFNPNEAIPYAAKELARLNEKFDGSWDHTVAAYNDGEGDVGRYDPNDFDGSMPEITRNYVNEVSPDRVQYAAKEEIDPLLALAKEVDDENSSIEHEADEALAMLEEAPKVEENLRTRGWLKDMGAAVLRGPLKGLSAVITPLSNPGSILAPEVFGTSSPAEEEIKPALDYLGAPETVPGVLTEGISQWATGFALTRRATSGLTSSLGSATASRSVAALKNTVDSAIASAVVFKGKEGNVGDFVESTKKVEGQERGVWDFIPDLSNPVTAWLADKTDNSELLNRAKNALADALVGAPLDIVANLRSLKKAQQTADAYADDALDTRPVLNIDKVSSRSIAEDNPLPKNTEVSDGVLQAETPAQTAQVKAASEVPSSGTDAPQVSLEKSPDSSDVIVRSANGEGHALETPDGIHISRVDVEEVARGKGEGLAILRAFAARAHSRGLPLFSDISISPAQVRVYEKLKAEGFNVKQNEATINPKTGNLVSTDRRKAVFEVEPAPAKLAEAAPTAPDAAAPQAAPVATQVAEAPKPDYASSPIDVTVSRLSKEIGLTDEMVVDVRGKLSRGEIQPEDVADLIGLNGSRIDWTGVADEAGMSGMLNTVMRVMEDTVGGAAGFRKVSVETVEKLVSKIGASADDAFDLFQSLKAKGGIEARVMAARITLHASAAKLFRLGKRVSQGESAPEELLELAIHDRRHMLLQAVVRGSTSMIGRSLRMLRESVRMQESAFKLSNARHERAVRQAQEGVDKVKATRKPKAQGDAPAQDDTALDHAQSILDNAKKAGRKLTDEDVADALSEIGYRPSQVRKLAKRIAAAENEMQIHKISRTTGFGKAMQGRLATLYINNILSGLPTLAINVTSGWLKIAETAIERYGAAAIKVARGGDKYDLIAAHRAVIATKVMWGGAWKAAAGAWKEGLPQVDLIGRAEVAIKGGVGQSTLEHLITAPSRAILTIDEYFKTIFYQQELVARAVEIAAGKARLFKGKAAKEAFDAEFKAVMENPTDDVRLDAIENARYQTFQSSLESEFGTGLVRWTNGTPALKFIVPFVRTPVNIMKQAMERTPLGLIRFAWRKDLRAAMANNTRAGNVHIVRSVLGLAAFGVIFDAAMDGDIKGSRKGAGGDKQSADFAEEVPYTIYGVQYNRLDPWGTVIGLTADLAYLYKEYRLRSDNDYEVDDPELIEAFGNVMSILSTNILDKTFFKGIADAVGMLSGSDTAPERAATYFKSLAANMVPFSSFQRNIARANDEYAREAFTLSDKLIAQTPFLRESLPVRRDYLGRPVREPERLGPDWLSPILISRDDPDPAAQEFAKLDMSYSMPDKIVGGIKLSAQQYSDYTELRGNIIRERIQNRMDSGDWSTKSRTQRQDIVRTLSENAGRKARAQLRRNYPDLGIAIEGEEAAWAALQEAAE